ncbi:hypothetical protein PS854_01808 [Pseudomonas fluorescens]|jgi:hypothetical protein|uniref:Uncharacterized protein n=1 Tax=Pseudomonas fluorescens TaxID=294 RepID=A0A5E7IZ59_PSEFL|nr:hypothetical protein PS854_01808 [Pseudomonas fluorescens]
MVVNDDAGNMTPRDALGFIASKKNGDPQVAVFHDIKLPD